MNKPISCPNCNNEDITITIQYKKSLLIRFLKFACIILLVFTVITNMKEIMQFNFYANNTNTNQSIITTSILLTAQQPIGTIFNPTGPIIMSQIIGWIFFEILQQYVETKPRIYYICKKCGKIWHEDEEINY